MSRIGTFAATLSVLLLLHQGAIAQSPDGTYQVDGNGFKGELVIRLGGRSAYTPTIFNVAGAVYGQRIVGQYDAHARILNFLRIQDESNRSADQFWRGHFSEGRNGRYLAGTYYSVGDPGGADHGLETRWSAQQLISPIPELGRRPQTAPPSRNDGGLPAPPAASIPARQALVFESEPNPNTVDHGNRMFLRNTSPRTIVATVKMTWSEGASPRDQREEARQYSILPGERVSIGNTKFSTLGMSLEYHYTITSADFK